MDAASHRFENRSWPITGGLLPAQLPIYERRDMQWLPVVTQQHDSLPVASDPLSRGASASPSSQGQRPIAVGPPVRASLFGRQSRLRKAVKWPEEHRTAPGPGRCHPSISHGLGATTNTPVPPCFTNTPQRLQARGEAIFQPGAAVLEAKPHFDGLAVAQQDLGSANVGGSFPQGLRLQSLWAPIMGP